MWSRIARATGPWLALALLTILATPTVIHFVPGRGPDAGAALSVPAVPTWALGGLALAVAVIAFALLARTKRGRDS